MRKLAVRLNSNGFRHRRTAATVVVIGFALLNAGCAHPASDSATSDPQVAVDVSATEPLRRDIQAEKLREIIGSNLLVSSFSDETLRALGDGICRQFTAGTDRATIIANVRAIAPDDAHSPDSNGYGSAASTPPLNPDQLAAVFVDAALAAYC